MRQASRRRLAAAGCRRSKARTSPSAQDMGGGRRRGRDASLASAMSSKQSASPQPAVDQVRDAASHTHQCNAKGGLDSKRTTSPSPARTHTHTHNNTVRWWEASSPAALLMAKCRQQRDRHAADEGAGQAAALTTGQEAVRAARFQRQPVSSPTMAGQPPGLHRCTSTSLGDGGYPHHAVGCAGHHGAVG